MSALSPGDFGEMGDLLKALGLVNGSEFNSDWIANPDDYLKDMLADQGQRDALLAFVSTVRGGPIERDPEGRQWIELFAEDLDPGVRILFFIVVDDAPQDEVRLFLGVRFQTFAPVADSASSLMFPLFRAGKKERPAPSSVELVGHPGGRIALTSEVTIASAAPAPGEAGLRAVGLRLVVPTAANDGDPQIGLTLRGLQLPGESTSRDLILSLSDPDAVRDAGIEFILGLLQAQIGNAAGVQARTLAKLLGLGADPHIPPFPVDDLLDRGAQALADWLATALGDTAKRTAWLQALADLLAAGATADGMGVTLPVGGAQLRIGLTAAPGASGRPVVTLSTSFGISGGAANVAVTADLVRLDLGTGAAVAVPSLRAEARFDLSGASMPNVSVDTLAVGFGLDQGRRPVLVVALENAVVFGTTHARLDLTNPAAVAAASAQAVTGALVEVLGNLGPAGVLIAVALGWEAPAGASAGYPTINLPAFLGDPLGALRQHWQEVLANHAADIPSVLAKLRELVTGDATAGAVIGSGTEADPWQLPLTAGLHIALWRGADGRLLIGVGFLRRVDTLGERCTVLETRVRAAILALDLAGGGASFLPEVSLSALGRARGGGRLVSDQGAIRLEVDHLGVAVRWTPDGGLDIRPSAPNPALYFNNVELPLPMPDFSRGFEAMLDGLGERQWEALERIAAVLAERPEARWFDDLVEALGWRPRAPMLGGPTRHRLALSALAADAGKAIREWLADLLADGEAAVERRLQPLARFLSGRPAASFAVDGRGTVTDPWRIDLLPGAGLPALAAWREPDAPLPVPESLLSGALRGWRPGERGLEPGELAQAILSEMPGVVGPFGAGLTPEELNRGLLAIAELWQGTDGLVQPPTGAPAGTVLHLVENRSGAALAADLNMVALIGVAPGTVVQVIVQGAGVPIDPALDLARLLDMREAGRDPAAFTPLQGGSGTWHVLLPPRADARLANGDPDGVRGQVARLKTAISQLTGVTLLADAAAGHAAWLALDEMGSGNDRLVAVGLPLAAAQVPAAPAPAAAEMLRRLGEFLPDPDAGDTDDADLAAARRLLSMRLRSDAPDLSGLALPAGWTGTKRADLEVHLVNGVFDRDTVRRALTAVTAAGLSLHAQARAEQRPARTITSASLGLFLPLDNAPAAGGIEVEGQALAELIGCDIDRSGPVLLPVPRAARRIVAGFEIRRLGGWLIGGPGATTRPLPLELRSIEVAVRLEVGGPNPDLDRCEVILHGVRIHDRAFPRLVLSPALPDPDLGIDGLAAPTTPEVRQLLSQVMQELEASADAALTRISEALKAAGILQATGGFDGLSLSNWIDDPGTRLQELLADPALRARLLDLVGDFAAEHAGLGFDPATRQFSVSILGATGEPVFEEWAIVATIGTAGLSTGALRLGALDGLHFAATLDPFSVALRLPADQALALGGMPETLPLWPAPNFDLFARPILPALGSFALSLILDGLRASDLGVKPVIDAALTAFGLLRTGAGGQDVAIPPLLFIDPGRWIAGSGALGTSGGGAITPARVIAALDALKPLVNLTGPAGTWELAPGIALKARAQGGTVLEIVFDPTLFMPSAEIAIGGAFGLQLGADGRVLPALDFSVGLRGAATGTRAVHLTVAGNDVRVFLRPALGADIGIYPALGGLAQLAAAGVIAALPAALDAIVATGSDAGHLLADIGDALQLRQAGSFDGAALTAWALDPAGTLEARWLALLAGGLARLQPALPAGIAVTTTAGGLRLQVDNAGTPGSVIAIVLIPNPIAVEVSASITTIPFVRAVEATLRFDATGLARLEATVGPAEIPLIDAVILRPVVEVLVGSAVTNPSVSIGLSVDAAKTNALALRYDLQAQAFDLAFGGNTPGEIAAGIMHFAVDLIGSFVTNLAPVQEILALDIGTSDVRGLLENVVLVPNGGLDPEFFRIVPNPGESAAQLLDSKRGRLLALIDNIAEATPSVSVGGQLLIRLTKTGGSIALSLGLSNRLAIADGDIMVWLENDSRWIINPPPAGIDIGLLEITAGGIDFVPSLAVNGVGLRIGKKNAPLLDSPLSLGSIALHVFARITQTERLGGAQVQLTEIGAAVGSAQGGNPIAQGMLAETNSGNAALAPAFSPAFSAQTRPSAQGGGIAFKFSAGEGEGPWWLPIRRQFGPLYIGQVGLGTQIANDSLQSISLLFDGGISIAGLAAAVDDLELRYDFSQGGIFDSSSWSVDLAGLAVSADLSGVTLAGGLRKFGEEPDVEYVGMLVARFAVYGLSLYGGYASVTEGPSGRFTAFFAFGAVTGPIGGPPAFFLTGIGGGFGINREIVPPTDMSQFDNFVMIAALDPSFDPPGDLMGYMEMVRNTFPARRDRFWFAAGISFNSFALVDGIAVVAVEFGQGFELSIFGLARLALPRPEVALVSIELGLMARFSSEEGVLWIQAQLTDNSWLLHRSARLTGGFAFVSWFRTGEFVLTLGGYHPNFRRDHYPVVPRLGFNWSVASNIVVKAEVYFALTSEAIMAGGLFEASATFGPAYAHLSFGGNAIVYFDPFRYEADAHARISAGIRIKTWFGTIKLSYTLGAAIEVRGPEFHGVARIDVGPISITVRFGNSAAVPAAYISWVDFAKKYMELAPGNRAQALSGIAGKGALPPASNSGSEPGTADGSAAHPFDVTSEFELSFTSTIPITKIDRPGAPLATPPSKPLGIAPANRVLHASTLHLSLKKDGSAAERLGDTVKIKMAARRTGAFPVGVWGPPQDVDNKKVPKGEVIGATEGVDFKFVPVLIGLIPRPATGGVSFNQVEAGPRKPLPLRSAGALRARLVREAADLRVVLAALDPQKMPALAAGWQQAGRSNTATRSWSGARAVPMRVGLLSERIVGTTETGTKRPVGKGPRVDLGAVFGGLKVRGVLAQTVRATAEHKSQARTTVTPAAPRYVMRIPPPTMNDAAAGRETRFASVLLRAEFAEPIAKKTLIARQVLPETLAPRMAAAASAGRAAASDRALLDGVAAMMMAPAAFGRASAAQAATPARALSAGEIAVFDVPAVSPRFASSGVLTVSGSARLVALGLDGRVVLNAFPAKAQTELPAAIRSFTLIAGAEPEAEMAGWVEGSRLAYLGQSLARCLGGFVSAEGASRSRGGKAAAMGWVQAGALTDQSALVTTRFDGAAESVALVLDGTVTDEDLAVLAISFEGAEAAEAKPLLVPFDGKTLIVYALVGGTGFSVSVGGQLPGTLDGVVAARVAPERLVSRLIGEAARLDLEAVAEGRSDMVTASWRAPADLEPEPVE